VYGIMMRCRQLRFRSDVTENVLRQLGIKSRNEGCYNGSWFGSQDYSVSYNPATRKPIAEVSLGNEAHYEEIVSAMDTAKGKWGNMSMVARGEVVRKIGVALREHQEPLGKLISLEMGKIVAEGIGEVQEAIDICDFASGLSRTICGPSPASEREEHFMIERWHPLKNHVAVITAFNFPVAVYFWNLALSMIMGNTNLWKCAGTTPLCAVASANIVAKVLEQENLDGAISSLINGPGRVIGQLISDDPRMDLISFTGSTSVGRGVNQAVAKRFGKTILELGGNNASIILGDADLKLALRAVLFGAVGTAGQRCTSLRRLFIHTDVYDQFVEKLEKSYSTVSIGNPLEKGVLCGPLHTPSAVKEFSDGIAEIKKNKYASIRYGGEVLDDMGGNFVRPTIVECQNHDFSKVPFVREELFAPILYVFRINDLQEAIALNNSVPQGLSSSLFTKDLRSSMEWIGPNGSDCGIVNINMGPSGAEIGGAFGGEKETGGGRESGSDSWKQYGRRVTATINYSTQLPLAQGIKFE